MLKPAEYTAEVEKALANLDIPASPKALYDPIRYTLQGGGKRLRPVLTLAVADALCGDPHRAINQALGVEMFHNFTLLHDDVMDNADTRRGRETVHKKWDVNTAILSGDTMLSLASKIVATDSSLEVVQTFNNAAIEVYEGQQLDMDFENRRDVTVDEYLEMISLKTGALIRLACQLGAMMSTDNPVAIKAFSTYGDMLGMAFQLQDDYLDTYGNPETFGKAIGGDIVNDKKTWLQIMALSEDHTGEVAHLIAGNIPPDVKIYRMRCAYDRLDLPERCHRLIDSYIRKATEALQAVESLDDEKRAFFARIARQSATRKN